MNKEMHSTYELQFSKVLNIILEHRGRAYQAVNEQQLFTAWEIGAYVSARIKSSEWGANVVSDLANYIKVHEPRLRGYSRRNIYNMVMFYDNYSSAGFIETTRHLLDSQFVQSLSAQIEPVASEESKDISFVQTVSAQMPSVVSLTGYSNHIIILNECETNPERLFYILYAHREKLSI